MVDRIVSIFTLALIVTGLGIALRKGSQTANVITAIGNSFSKIQKAAAA